jgi:hypothetical protein
MSVYNNERQRMCERRGDCRFVCVGAPGSLPAGPPVSGVGVPAGI